MLEAAVPQSAQGAREPKGEECAPRFLGSTVQAGRAVECVGTLGIWLITGKRKGRGNKRPRPYDGTPGLRAVLQRVVAADLPFELGRKVRVAAQGRGVLDRVLVR